jgi:hypothetical protein
LHNEALYNLGDEMSEDEMGESYSMHGREEKYLGIDRRTVLNGS